MESGDIRRIKSLNSVDGVHLKLIRPFLASGPMLAYINNILPDDILEEIFLYVLPSPFGSHAVSHIVGDHGEMAKYKASSLDTKKVPWTLTRVCSRWRSVAVSLAILWREVGVVVTKPSRGGPKGQSRASKLNRARYLLQLQLQRSAETPLRISFYMNIPTSVSKTALPSYLSVPELLFTSAHRWDSLHVDVSAHNMSCLKGIEFPALRTLSVGHGNEVFATDAPYPWSYFSNAPLLTKLLGSSLALKSAVRKDTLPLAQITSISEINAHHHMWLPEVNHPVSLPNLRVCVMRPGVFFAEDIVSSNLQRSSARLEHLESMNIQSLFQSPSSRLVACTILASLTLPRLRSLTISGRVSSRRLLALQERSNFALTYMCIDANGTKSMKSAIHAFRHFPSLKHIRFTVCKSKVVEQFFAAMKKPGSQMLPNLELLELDCVELKKSGDDASSDVLQRRFRVERVLS